MTLSQQALVKSEVVTGIKPPGLLVHYHWAMMMPNFWVHITLAH